MLIKRNTYFSAIDQETGEERLFSVNELLSEDEYLERLYSHEEKGKKRIPLRSIDSHRGLGRAAILGGHGGMIGGYLGKRKAEELDEEGKTDSQIIRGSSEHAGKLGAISGGALGAAGGAYAGSLLKHATGRGSAGALGTYGAGIGAVSGAVGAYLGAKKNAEKKTEKRKRMEELR